MYPKFIKGGGDPVMKLKVGAIEFYVKIYRAFDIRFLYLGS